MLSFITWNVDPMIFSLFGLEVRWYGLCWALGLLGAIWVVQKIYTFEKHPEKWFDSLFLYVVLGTIIGARLGHCLFYNPEYYLANPLEIFKIWEGGLASHGGTIGIVVGVWLYSRKIKKSIIWTLDRVVVSVGFTAALIRIGNLMNSEIYGHETTLPWAFKFITNLKEHWVKGAEAIYTLPSHPTQIYEALVYIFVFALTMYMYWKTNAKEKQGLLLGVAITIIFGSRFFFEYLKNVQEPFEIEMIATYGINMGQLLSIPFVIWGVWLIYKALTKKNNTTVDSVK